MQHLLLLLFVTVAAASVQTVCLCPAGYDDLSCDRTIATPAIGQLRKLNIGQLRKLNSRVVLPPCRV